MERFLQTEQETLKLRLVAALGAAAGLYVQQFELSLFWVFVLALAYSAYVAYSLVLRYYLLPRFNSSYLIYGMIVVDTVALTSVIYVMGGVNSALVILFPIFITYYAIHLGYVGSFTAATIATVGIGTYVVSTGLTPIAQREAALAVAMFYITAMFSGYLGQRGIRGEAERQALEELLNLESGARSLLDVAKTLTSTLELEALLQVITRLSPSITGFPYSVAMLLDERGEKLVGKAANVSLQDLKVKRLDLLVEQVRADSIATRAWETGEVVAISQIGEDMNGLRLPPTQLNAQSLLAIPLLTQGEPAGIVYAYDNKPGHDFTEGEIRLAQGFGDLTTIAIANAKLYQEAQEKVASLVTELENAVQRMERIREPRRRLVITLNGLQIDTANQRVVLKGEPIELSPTEYRLLIALAETPGTPISQEVLFRKTWGDVYRGQTNAVDVYIHRLRKKLEENASSPTRILTVRGVGYKLMDGS